MAMSGQSVDLTTLFFLDMLRLRGQTVLSAHILGMVHCMYGVEGGGGGGRGVQVIISKCISFSEDHFGSEIV